MLPEEIRNLTGMSFGTTVFQVEKETVRRFADAVGDMNPLYHDADYAGNSEYGGIIAPPGYISSQWFWGDTGPADGEGEENISGLGDIFTVLSNAGYRQAIDSSIEYEFYHPVRVGDTVTAVSRVRDIVERGKDDERAVFLFIETEYSGQDGAQVAVCRVTTTHR